jgi:hypothetical protein
MNIRTKLTNTKPKNKPFSEGTYLDTLVQLRTGTDSQSVTNVSLDQKKYQKRAKAKAISNAITMRLVDVKSPLTKYYWRAYHCSNIITQTGKTLTGSYCNTRHCLVCNRIRTAKAIHGYSKPLLELSKSTSKHSHCLFSTLTRQSVKAEDLKRVITEMNSNYRNIQKNLKNTYGITLKGIRKFECNYNPLEETFNPHFHLVVGGKPCEILLQKTLWLNQYPIEVATPKAQKITPTSEGFELELFKYMTKMVYEDGHVFPKSLDTIFKAIKGKRIMQPFGGIKKVSEDVDGIEKEDVDFITSNNDQWQFSDIVTDWTNEWGEVLSNYTPSHATIQYINNIKTNKQITKWHVE